VAVVLVALGCDIAGNGKLTTYQNSYTGPSFRGGTSDSARGARFSPVAHDETSPRHQTCCRDYLPDEVIERPVAEGIATGAPKDKPSAVLAVQHDSNAIALRAGRDTLAYHLPSKRDRVLLHLNG
jgi:hypothetical protein